MRCAWIRPFPRILCSAVPLFRAALLLVFTTLPAPGVFPFSNILEAALLMLDKDIRLPPGPPLRFARLDRCVVRYKTIRSNINSNKLLDRKPYFLQRLADVHWLGTSIRRRRHPHAETIRLRADTPCMDVVST